MEYIIGMDCGGTKITAEAFDTKGNSLGTAYGSSGNLIVDYMGALTNIRDTFASLVQQLQGSCQLLTLGVAGIQSSGLEVELLEDLKDLDVPVKLFTDAQFAYLSHFSDRTGILMIAGTGSIAIGLKHKQWQRVGGWGHLLGDEGSGYWIGLKAVQQALKESDEGVANSLLSLAVYEHFQVDSVYKLVSEFYKASKAQIAVFTETIADSSTQDETAAAILKQAGQELAQQTLTLANNLQKNTISVLISGSVLEQIDLVYRSYSQYLADSPIHFQVERRKQSVTTAAVTIWRKFQQEKND